MRGVLGLLIAAIVWGAAAAPAAAQEAAPSTLAAAGVGEAFLVPDQAELYVSVNRVARTSRRARAVANRRLRRIRRALRAHGIAPQDVQTLGVSVSRERVRARRGRRARTRYRAGVDLTVRTSDVPGLAGLIGAVADAGADDVGGPEFSHSDPSQGLIAATRAALADARRRADDAAAQTGHRITGVRSIDLDPTVENFSLGSEDAAGGGSAGEIEIDPGRLRFGALVKVVYAIAPVR